jgi:hypothetical protein
LREGEEGYAEGEDHVSRVKMRQANPVQKMEKWEEVFKESKSAEVERNSEKKPELLPAGLFARFPDQCRAQVIHNDRTKQKQKKRRTPIAVECQRTQRQPAYDRVSTPSA